MMVSFFSIAPINLGSIPSRVVPKSQIMELHSSLFRIIHSKDKWNNPEKGVAPFRTRQ